MILGDVATQGRALSRTALLFVYAVGHCLSMLVARTSGGVVEFFAGRTGSPIGRLGRDGSAACWTPWWAGSELAGQTADISGARGPIVLHVAGANLTGSNAAIASAWARVVTTEKMAVAPTGSCGGQREWICCVGYISRAEGRGGVADSRGAVAHSLLLEKLF